MSDDNSVDYRQSNRSFYRKFIEENQIVFTGFILCSLNVLNVTDRFVVSSVLIDVENYFKVSKSTAGLLQTAFMLCYMAFSPLNGYLGDRINRKYLLITSIVIWVISTVGGSFIPSDKFYLFVLSRCLFGVATASFETIAVPIIGDRIVNKPIIRNRIIALFCMGPPLGTGFSYLIGIIAKSIKPNDWRYAMRLTPFCLIFILIIILFTYIEPDRSLNTNNNMNINDKKNKTSFLDDLKTLLNNRTYILLTLCWITGLGSFGGFSWWSPTLIDYSLRNKKLDYNINDYKKVYSILQALCGVFGLVIPFNLSDYLKKKFTIKSDCFLISIGFYLSSLFLYIYLLTINLNVYLTLIIYSFMLCWFNLCWILETNIFLDIVPPYLRSTANSIMICLLHLIGDSSSPYWIGLITDKCINSFDYSNTLSNLIYCSQISLYPLVFLYFIAATFALFTTLSFVNDMQKARASFT